MVMIKESYEDGLLVLSKKWVKVRSVLLPKDTGEHWKTPQDYFI